MYNHGVLCARHRTILKDDSVSNSDFDSTSLLMLTTTTIMMMMMVVMWTYVCDRKLTVLWRVSGATVCLALDVKSEITEIEKQ